MAEQTENKAAAGGFAPLKIPLFAVLWGATVLGNVGSFMRDVASSWLITDLSSNPSAVALMQTAATLPVFLLAIPAGVLSDILDRRRFLIFVQILLACVSGSLLLLSQTGALTVEYLLALTFVGGIGAALMGPTWQAIVPELVPRAELKNAVALNSLGINIARSIGPAAGGLLLALLAVIVAISIWTPLAQTAIAERWFSLPNLFFLLPVPLLVAAISAWLWRALRNSASHLLPFVLTLGLIFLGFSGLGISIWPYIIPPGITLWQAAAPPQSWAAGKSVSPASTPRAS